MREIGDDGVERGGEGEEGSVVVGGSAAAEGDVVEFDERLGLGGSCAEASFGDSGWTGTEDPLQV